MQHLRLRCWWIVAGVLLILFGLLGFMSLPQARAASQGDMHDTGGVPLSDMHDTGGVPLSDMHDTGGVPLTPHHLL